MTAGFRTLHTSAKGIVKLLQALSADPDVRIITDGIPPGAAVGRVTVDGHNFEIEIVSHLWPNDAPPDIDLMYAVKIGNEWGMPTPLARTDA